MGSGSETSSDQETGVGRSYECTYCKRGFTNAQALGGHMNIHRKDKVKAKHQKNFTTTTTISTKTNKDDQLIVSANSFNLIPNDQEAQYLRSSLGFPTGDHGYQFTTSNPNFPWSFAASEFDNRALHEERLRVDLNLGIGTSEMDGTRKLGEEDWFDKEIDLELRLGHYP
ncbi:hypothetical protein LXL04_022970 [Taraxacum kok-saghyz]